MRISDASVAVLGITAGTLAGVLLGRRAARTRHGSRIDGGQRWAGWRLACRFDGEKRISMRVVTSLGIIVSLLSFL